MASANAVLDNACSKRTRSRPDSRRRASRGRKAAGIRCPAGSSWAALAPAAADARKGTAGWAGARCWGLPGAPGSLGGVASCDRWIKRCNARGNRPALAGQPTVVRLVREGCHDEAGPGALPIYSVICTCTGRAPSTVLAPATPQPWLPAPSCSWPWPSRSWPLPTLCARVMGRHTAVRTRGCAAIVLVGGARRAQARTRTAVASADRTAEPRRGACLRLPALNSAGEPNRGSRFQLGSPASRPTTSTRPQTDLCSSSCIFKFQSPSSLTPSLLPSGAYEKNKTGFNSCQFGKLSAKWEKYYGALPSHKFNRKKVRGVGADSTWAAASSRAAAGDECQHEARLSMCRPSHAPCAALRQVRSDSRCREGRP